MSDHNIIQIETNIKIVKEKQNQKIKKTSYRDLNFFKEYISWASIDADLSNTSWDMLNVNTDEMYKIIINICLEICKKHVCQRKVRENTKFSETEGVWWEKDQNCKIKHRRQHILKPKKMY